VHCIVSTNKQVSIWTLDVVQPDGKCFVHIWPKTVKETGSIFAKNKIRLLFFIAAFPLWEKQF